MSETTLFNWTINGVSHEGKKRRTNEDSIGWHNDIENQWLCAVLADGMGGHAAGEIASSMARSQFLDLVEHLFTEPKSKDHKHGLHPSEHTMRSALSEFIRRVDMQIKTHAEFHPEDKGLGTTLVALVIYSEQAWIVNIGDSRCYRFRDNQLQQLTRDDTLVQSWIDNGKITYELAEKSPYKNVLTQALGAKEELSPQILSVEIAPGDRFLLCSDGLTGCIDDRMICDTLKQNAPEPILHQLLDEALALGAPDNVSLILIGEAK